MNAKTDANKDNQPPREAFTDGLNKCPHCQQPLAAAASANSDRAWGCSSFWDHLKKSPIIATDLSDSWVEVPGASVSTNVPGSNITTLWHCWKFVNSQALETCKDEHVQLRSIIGDCSHDLRSSNQPSKMGHGLMHEPTGPHRYQSLQKVLWYSLWC